MPAFTGASLGSAANITTPRPGKNSGPFLQPAPQGSQAPGSPMGGKLGKFQRPPAPRRPGQLPGKLGRIQRPDAPQGGALGDMLGNIQQEAQGQQQVLQNPRQINQEKAQGAISAIPGIGVGGRRRSRKGTPAPVPTRAEGRIDPQFTRGFI